MFIPKKLGHIWIGPYSAPFKWLNTWKDKHPQWDYTLYDNNFLNKFKFKNQDLIDEYLKRGMYSGVSDLMRLEILYEFGGFLTEADSICYHNTDELWNKKCAYTVYENEFSRGKSVSPIYACQKNNEFVATLIEELNKINPNDLNDPWLSTGNYFVAKMIEELKPDIIIFPSHYFIPIHYDGTIYQGNDKVYGKQLFGSTQKSYPQAKPNLLEKIKLWYLKKKTRRYNRAAMRKINEKTRKLFDIDFYRP